LRSSSETMSVRLSCARTSLSSSVEMASCNSYS
jgi:hypothetical protein